MRGDSCSALLAPLTPQIIEVLNDIERMEKDWFIPDYPTDHSYGRVPGEKELRFWSVPASTGLLLYSLIQAKKPRVILEIGASAGYSAIWMGAAATTYGGRLFTVEICPEKIDIAKANIARAGLEQTISLIPGDAIEISRTWEPSLPIDFAFLDADKENYHTYLRNLAPYMSKDALLCADNALDYRSLMLEFIAAAKTQSAFESLTLNLDNGILILCPKV